MLSLLADYEMVRFNGNLFHYRNYDVKLKGIKTSGAMMSISIGAYTNRCAGKNNCFWRFDSRLILVQKVTNPGGHSYIIEGMDVR